VLKQKGKSALLEIGVEELPARFIYPALNELKEIAKKDLAAGGLEFSNLEVWGTPRRLTLLINGLPPKAADREEVVIGPPPKAAKDEKGNWTAVATGFAKAQKISVNNLETRETAKGERLVAVRHVRGLPADLVLKSVFPAVISQITFPKSMIWESSGIRFARPIRWIVAIFQKKVIRFKYAGVSSDKTTLGLLALGGLKIPISGPETYQNQLRNRCILVDPEERKQKILGQLDSIPKKIRHGLKAIVKDEHLEEVVNLTEYPVGIRGQFQETFLSLPKEILVSVLRKHQKFFPIENSNGEITQFFIGVRNGPSDSQEGVKEGYERVTTARLADAHFFFEHDLKISLESLVGKLSGVSFIENMGTMLDKTERIKKLAGLIADELSLDPEPKQAIQLIAKLSKADILTQLVGEFPELQGVAGRIFLKLKGENLTGDGVEQHYWPLTAEGKLPSTPEASIVSVADKMDTLAANFALGLIPTGSQDPFGLRRSSIGSLRIILERTWPIPVIRLIDWAVSGLPSKFSANQEIKEKLALFLNQRLSSWLANQGYKSDEIDAVIANPIQSLATMFKKVKDLKEARTKPEFDALSIAIKRAANIIKQARERNLLPPSADGLNLENAEPVESKLIEALKTAAPKVGEAVSKENFQAAFVELANLKEPVDAFFEGVMVMVEDAAARDRRLTILVHVKNLFDSVADFSKLQPPQSDPKPA